MFALHKCVSFLKFNLSQLSLPTVIARFSGLAYEKFDLQRERLIVERGKL